MPVDRGAPQLSHTSRGTSPCRTTPAKRASSERELPSLPFQHLRNLTAAFGPGSQLLASGDELR